MKYTRKSRAPNIKLLTFRLKVHKWCYVVLWFISIFCVWSRSIFCLICVCYPIIIIQFDQVIVTMLRCVHRLKLWYYWLFIIVECFRRKKQQHIKWECIISQQQHHSLFVDIVWDCGSGRAFFFALSVAFNRSHPNIRLGIVIWYQLINHRINSNDGWGYYWSIFFSFPSLDYRWFYAMIIIIIIIIIGCDSGNAKLVNVQVLYTMWECYMRVIYV